MGVDDKTWRAASGHTTPCRDVRDSQTHPPSASWRSEWGQGQARDKDRGAEKGCSEGNTHNTKTFSPSFSSLGSWDSSTADVKNLSRRVEQALPIQPSLFALQKHSRGHRVLTLPLSHSLSPAPPHPSPSGQCRPQVFPRELNGKRKEQQRAVIKHQLLLCSLQKGCLTFTF